MGSLTGDETKVLLYGYALPAAGTVLALGAYRALPDGLRYFRACRKPSWAPRVSRIYTISDLVAVSPVGCAALLAYRSGGGCSNADVSVGLAAYSASMGLSALVVPVFLSQELRATTAICAAATLAGAASVVFFIKAGRTPGLLMLPWTALHIFYTVLLANTKPPKDA